MKGRYCQPRYHGFGRTIGALALGLISVLPSCQSSRWRDLGKNVDLYDSVSTITTDPESAYIKLSFQVGKEEPDFNNEQWLHAGNSPVKFKIDLNGIENSEGIIQHYSIGIMGADKNDPNSFLYEYKGNISNGKCGGMACFPSFDPGKYPHLIHTLINARKKGYKDVFVDVEGFPPELIEIDLEPLSDDGGL